MRSALDPAGHRVPRTKATCLLHTWSPHRRRPFALVLHLHQHQSSRNLHLQYLANNQSTQRCQSLITQGSDHPPVLEPHMVLRCGWRQGRNPLYRPALPPALPPRLTALGFPDTVGRGVRSWPQRPVLPTVGGSLAAVAHSGRNSKRRGSRHQMYTSTKL
jgi:hypothetical protein